jgi:hypothetical protein
MKWTTLREQLGLTDHAFGRRINSKIKEYETFENETLPILKTQFAEADADDQPEIEEKIETVKAALKDLNTQLCGDLRRTHSTLGKQDTITANLKNRKAGTEQPAGLPQADQAPAGATAQTAATTQQTSTQTAATTIKETSPGTETGSSPKPTTKQATAASTQDKPAATVKKKSNTGWIVFFSLLAAGAGFGIGKLTR